MLMSANVSYGLDVEMMSPPKEHIANCYLITQCPSTSVTNRDLKNQWARTVENYPFRNCLSHILLAKKLMPM